MSAEVAKTAKVTITASQTIHYRKVVDIPVHILEEYHEMVKSDEDADFWLAAFADAWIDPMTDEENFDDFDDVEIHEVLVKEEDPVKP
jgi:hypothetical protein